MYACRASCSVVLWAIPTCVILLHKCHHWDTRDEMGDGALRRSDNGGLYTGRMLMMLVLGADVDDTHRLAGHRFTLLRRPTTTRSRSQLHHSGTTTAGPHLPNVHQGAQAGAWTRTATRPSSWTPMDPSRGLCPRLHAPGCFRTSPAQAPSLAHRRRRTSLAAARV